MAPDRQSYASRHEILLPALFSKRRAKGVAAEAARTLNLTVADALSAFATVLVLAAPHLEVFVRCIFHGKG